MIRKIALTPAHVHDGNMFGAVLSGDEAWAFADKAYDSEKNQGIRNGILIKGARNRELTHIEKRCNRILSKLRTP